MLRKKHNKDFYDDSNSMNDILSKDKTFIKKYPRENDALRKSLMAIALPSMIYETLENRGQDAALEQIYKLERVVKFVPHNFDIYSLLDKGSDLPYIGGRFSTFDYELANMKKHNMPTHLIHARANDLTKDSVFNHAEKLANDIIKLMLSKKFINLVKFFEKSGSVTYYSAFLTAFAEDLAARERIKERVTVIMLETWDDAPEFVKQLKETNYRVKGFYLRLKLKNTKEVSQIFICKSCLDASENQEIFLETLSVFAHEFGHFIDSVAPDCGALGAQIMAYCGYPTTKTQAEYLEIPTEKSAYKVQELLAHQIRQLLLNKR